MNVLARATLALSLLLTGLAAQDTPDVLHELQDRYVATRAERLPRLWWSGTQVPDESGWTFSNHTSHSNRLVPVWAFGRHVDVGRITGPNSPYRSAEAVEDIYGYVAPGTVHAGADHGDQTQIHGLLRGAVDRGARRVIVLILDGADWPTYQAACVHRTGSWVRGGLGRGLSFMDLRVSVGAGADARPAHSSGFVVTSPKSGRFLGGYNPGLGGPTPWATPDAAGRTYLVGDQGDTALLVRSIETPHAVTDSAASATSIFSGRKTANGRINMDFPARRPFVPILRELQTRGFAVGTVTDVPFSHATPAGAYASALSRRHYGTIARQMLGLERLPGLDVVIGCGHACAKARCVEPEDLERVREAGVYAVVTPVAGQDGGELLAAAAEKVVERRAAGAREGRRLFGLFGSEELDHLPYPTADGRYDPSDGIAYRSPSKREPAETYTPEELAAQPTLDDMTRAALRVLGSVPERPFALLVEAGKVDWALHNNNLDHAIGEVLVADRVFRTLVAWIERESSWEESVLLVTSDHGHLMWVDLDALARLLREGR